jgi:hypothetical protein
MLLFFGGNIVVYNFKVLEKAVTNERYWRPGNQDLGKGGNQ